MVAALQAVVVPVLRQKGFNGSFPHFRRKGEQKIDLLTFQFDRYGGGFVIELGRCPLEGFTTHWGEHIPPGKVRAWDVHIFDRSRIEPHPDGGRTGWFRYDKPVRRGDVFIITANRVIPFLDDAEDWWSHPHDKS